ncbi:hypothetical protein PG994_015332 [Apiospora phragmitis]|uniref:Uncharacterized protein n=1 Tax=Apiospora phragmitis TaxID=2905665 RepID=A0ABR1SR79_9PEZI
MSRSFNIQEQHRGRSTLSIAQESLAITQENLQKERDDNLKIRRRLGRVKYVNDALREQLGITQEELHEEKDISSKFERELNGLKYVNKTLRQLLGTTQEELNKQRDVNSEIQRRLNLNEAQVANTEVYRKKWAKAVSQLDQSRSCGQYKLPDSDLTRAVYQLRYEIENTIAQYFTITPSEHTVNTPNNSFWKYMVEATPGSHDYRDHLSSTTRGEHLIQSFLWRLLVGEIFGKFRWVPSLQESLSRIYETLRPVKEAPEAERQLQMWKAMTSNLIFKHLGLVHEQVYQEEISKTALSFARKVLDVIKPYLQGPDEDLLDGLQSIIQLSIKLDQDFCRLGARYSWFFPPFEQGVLFDLESMEVEVREKKPQPGQFVCVVVAPALMKRGKQTGEDFAMEIRLLKMKVSCGLFDNDDF